MTIITSSHLTLIATILKTEEKLKNRIPIDEEYKF